MDATLRQRVSLKNPVHFLALGFGSGLVPVMPGTFGSLAAFPIILAMSWLPLWGYLLATLIICVAGIWICGKTAKEMQVHDHGSIVWDEVAGMAVTFIAVPLSLTNLIVGFLLFRLFDILKPWPINAFDKRIHGGTGIMLDDLAAGGLAMLVLHGLIMFSVLL
ncbi:phosphatidylglycerophosphatase A [Aestuariibacter salexigens]|uniref:phosphatidylglycerophosphatase A family protein n=1 Tax=Aestuariibacter salexigens TaxID=226010 RepID=UPI000403EBB0|nr:phosphatidylglycerophosphatase A [Aestuariibacter salexigens]